MTAPDKNGGAESAHAGMQAALDAEVRLTELEIKLGFSEDLLEELNRTVYKQQQEIVQLQRAIRELRDQLRASQPAEQASLRDELPPHY